MQRLMFPMRGFHQHFPFVTPSVTWQVEWTAMFPGCVAMSGVLARLARLAGTWPPSGRRRHMAVTWPEAALERPAGPDVRVSHARPGRRLPQCLRGGRRKPESAHGITGQGLREPRRDTIPVWATGRVGTVRDGASGGELGR